MKKLSRAELNKKLVEMLTILEEVKANFARAGKMMLLYIDEWDESYANFKNLHDFDVMAGKLGVPKYSRMCGLCLIYMTDDDFKLLMVSGDGLFHESNVKRAMYTEMQQLKNGRVVYRFLTSSKKFTPGYFHEMNWVQVDVANYSALLTVLFDYYWSEVVMILSWDCEYSERKKRLLKLFKCVLCV